MVCSCVVSKLFFECFCARLLFFCVGVFSLLSEEAAMKLIACALAGLGLIASAARADEAKVEVKADKNSAKIEKKHICGSITHKTKVESKARHRMGGGTVSKTEIIQETNCFGIGNNNKT